MFGPAHSASRRAEHFLLTSIVNYSCRVFFWTRPARANDHGKANQCDTQHPGSQAITFTSTTDVQSLSCCRVPSSRVHFLDKARSHLWGLVHLRLRFVR